MRIRLNRAERLCNVQERIDLCWELVNIESKLLLLDVEEYLGRKSL